jgi:hypothetical protein
MMLEVKVGRTVGILVNQLAHSPMRHPHIIPRLLQPLKVLLLPRSRDNLFEAMQKGLMADIRKDLEDGLTSSGSTARPGADDSLHVEQKIILFGRPLVASPLTFDGD